MKIKDLAASDRPREKLLKFGAPVLSNSELLAILLGSSGCRERSVIELSRALLGSENNFRQLSMKSVAEIKKEKGVGDAKAVMIAAVFEIAHRFEEEQLPLVESLDSPAEIYAHFFSRFRDAREETFILLGLSRKNKILFEKKVGMGCESMVCISARELFRTAVEMDTAGIVLIHNHPSGISEPSEKDKKITKRISDSGKMIGIPLLDHIIISESGYFSFHESLFLTQ